VIDGDTIEVRLDGRVERVRYIGIDTPELKHPTRGEEPGGRDAMELNRQLIAGKNVRLELDVQERDRYGRLLAYVWVKQEGEREVMVNAALLWHGYAQVMTIAPNVKYADYLHELQRQARETRRGLWGNALGGGGIEPSGSDISPSARVGVPPQDPRTCAPSHPVKGNFTTYSGERCIYHVPGGEFYDKTKPERCYAMEQDARRDGCRRSRR
jgi:micrococcal nuclease